MCKPASVRRDDGGGEGCVQIALLVKPSSGIVLLYEVSIFSVFSDYYEMQFSSCDIIVAIVVLHRPNTPLEILVCIPVYPLILKVINI